MLKYQDIDKQLEIKNEIVGADDEEYIQRILSKKDATENQTTTSSLPLDTALRSVIISHITYGSLDLLHR